MNKEEEFELELAEKAIDAAINKNKELCGTMDSDQEYWFQEGYKGAVKEVFEFARKEYKNWWSDSIAEKFVNKL